MYYSGTYTGFLLIFSGEKYQSVLTHCCGTKQCQMEQLDHLTLYTEV
jgi:hypothetical protein